MLLNFVAQNFMSIKELSLLDLVPTRTYKTHPENISEIQNHKILNTLAVFGANASGKTNLIRAFTAAILTIRGSSMLQPNAPIRYMRPFAFDKVTLSKPCVFEFTFLAQDNVKYIYGFSATREKVIAEYLYAYYSFRPSCIFEREKSSVYTCPESQRKSLEPLFERNSENKLFLATAAQWNYEKAKPAYQWFATQVDTYDDPNAFQVQSVKTLDEDKESKFKDFSLQLLKQADINITDYQLIQEKIPNGINPSLTPGLLVKTDTLTDEKSILNINMIHTVENDGREETYSLPLQNESLGTIQLFYFSSAIQEALIHGKTMIVDELDKSLHPFVAEYLVRIFQNPESNPKHAQLIFTAHDTNLLSLDLFRPDQIYFTEKSEKTGSTDLYSLADFKSRQTDNVEKNYLLGRYGAIPYIKGESLA